MKIILSKEEVEILFPEPKQREIFIQLIERLLDEIIERTE